jgi:outer membrane protein assembly factor BamD
MKGIILEALPSRLKGIILIFIFLTGCATSGEKSELLNLLGVDEKIADTSDQGVESIYDALTLLKRGEAYFVKGEYIEASQEFLRFLELHPFHRMAAFAQYRLGMSYYHQMNTNDRDPGPMEKALAAFQKVVTQYPESLYTDESREKIGVLQHRQAEHHFYVGHFYYKNSAYPAAISRFKKVLAQEEQGSLAEKTLYYLGLSHYYGGDQKNAHEVFEKLLKEHPRSSYTRESEEMISNLSTTSGS